MTISANHNTHYQQHGYVIVDDVFTSREITAMIAEVETGERVAKTTVRRQDTTGRSAGLAIWHEMGDDIWAAVATNPRLVNAVRCLMGEEIAFFHGKVSMKEAHTGGRWEWHQDYGYWYNQGFLYPRMLSAFIALDPCTEENGALRVLDGSHHLGRIEHGTVAGQTGVDRARITALENHFEEKLAEMKPGSVLFFHCNLLHASSANNSSQHRRAYIVCYNALANPQIAELNGGKTTVDAIPCPVGPDDGIERFADRILAES